MDILLDTMLESHLGIPRNADQLNFEILMPLFIRARCLRSRNEILLHRLCGASVGDLLRTDHPYSDVPNPQSR